MTGVALSLTSPSIAGSALFEVLEFLCSVDPEILPRVRVHHLLVLRRRVGLDYLHGVELQDHAAAIRTAPSSVPRVRLGFSSGPEKTALEAGLRVVIGKPGKYLLGRA